MKLYVGTYHKYNCGSIEGEWLNLDDFSCSEDFYAECLKIHKDEKDPELMFQDFEAEYSWESALYCECSLPEVYWEIKSELESRQVDPEVFGAYVELCGGSPTAEEVAQCEDTYRGRYTSLEDFVIEFYEETGLLDEVPAEFKNYIDFESIARDWDLSGEVEFNDGFVFCR